MIKDLVNPSNFNLMVSKVGDILVRALDTPLGYAINWGRVWSLWPVHLETACSVWNLELPRVQDMTSKDLV